MMKTSLATPWLLLAPDPSDSAWPAFDAGPVAVVGYSWQAAAPPTAAPSESGGDAMAEEGSRGSWPPAGTATATAAVGDRPAQKRYTPILGSVIPPPPLQPATRLVWQPVGVD
jgi:hypothetical protein